MRLKERRDWMAKQEVNECPKIIKIVEKLKQDSMGQAACFTGESVCQVSSLKW